MTERKNVPAYMKEVRDAGIEVSPYEARRFRAMLTNYAAFEAYMRERITPLDAAWLETIIRGSDRHKEQLEEGKPESDLPAIAAEEFMAILNRTDSAESERAEAGSKWLLGWVSENGLVKLRSAMNGLAHNQRRKRSPIGVYQTTRDRFNGIMANTDASSADEMLNLMIDAYEALHGR